MPKIRSFDVNGEAVKEAEGVAKGRKNWWMAQWMLLVSTTTSEEMVLLLGCCNIERRAGQRFWHDPQQSGTM